VRALLLATAERIVVPVVPELRGDDDLVALLAERVGEQRLALAAAVSVGRVEEVDAQLVRPPQQADADGVVRDSPPCCRHRPKTETHGRDLEAGVTKFAILHI